MLKTTRAQDLNTGEERIVVVGENILEDRFLLWFSTEYDIPKTMINGREVLMFDTQNDINQLSDNMEKAFRSFKQTFGYSEIPNTVGLSLDEGAMRMADSGHLWTIDREEYSEKYPTGTITAQNPQAGITSALYNPIRLTIANNTLPPKQNFYAPPNTTNTTNIESIEESIENDEVFKRFLT